MITQLVITDLTRMQHGHICIAGYDKDQNCIRLVQPPPGVSELSIIDGHQATVFPFAVVEVNLLQHRPDPPHIEDHLYDPPSLRFLRRAQEDRKQTILGWSLFQTVTELFGQPILHDPGYYIPAGSGVRSLGTIIPHAIKQVEYKEGFEGAWDYRIIFKDGESWYNLKITDLTWHYYCDRLRATGREPQEIASDLTQMLKHRSVFLRIGLSRGWIKFPGRCFLQINGIHTLPDYLAGSNFVDLMGVSRG